MLVLLLCNQSGVTVNHECNTIIGQIQNQKFPILPMIKSEFWDKWGQFSSLSLSLSLYTHTHTRTQCPTVNFIQTISK